MFSTDDNIFFKDFKAHFKKLLLYFDYQIVFTIDQPIT